MRIVLKQWNDGRTALLLGLIVGGAAYFLNLPGVAPSVWTDLAVAAGTRPPEEMFPGLWRLLVTALYRCAGIQVTLAAVPAAGCVALGVVTGFSYLMFVAFLSSLGNVYPRIFNRYGTLLRLSSFFGAVAFSTSDTVWQAGQAGAPLILLATVIFAAFAGVGRFLRTGVTWVLYPAAFLLGAFSADSPFVIVLTVGWALIYRLAESRICQATGRMKEARARLDLVRWKITFMYILGFLAAVGAIFGLFVLQGGPEANGIMGTALIVTYVSQWIAQATAAATPAGWLLVGVLFVSTFALALMLARRALDAMQFFPFWDGLLYIVLSLVAYSQLSVISSLWVWNWSERTMVASPTLRVLCLALASSVVAMGVMVMCVYVFCRAHEVQRADLEDEDEEYRPHTIRLTERLRTRRSLARGRFAWALVVMIVFLAGMIGDQVQTRLRDERRLIEAYLDETMAEAGDCVQLFTDGRFDDVLRLRVKAAGAETPILRGLYLPYTPLNVTLLARGIGAAELSLAARQGAATFLRTVLRDFPNELKHAAFQVGFEQWRRNLSEMPPVGGVVARTAWPEGLREKGRAAAAELTQKVLDYYTTYGLGNGGDRETFGYLETVQWRLARMARVRADQCDFAGDVTGARAETARAELLDAHNGSLRRIQADMVEAERRCQRSVSPREALAGALRGANFKLASFYAEQILVDEPTNRPANFAMGMALVEKGQYAQAIDHLKRSLAPGSNDPVLYNNLAMAQLGAGQLEAARTNALQAVRLAPKVTAVRDTLQRIEAATRAKAAQRK